MRKIFRVVVPALILGVSGAPAFAVQPKKGAPAAPVAAAEVPDKPGAYSNLPTRKKPALTYSIRLPKSYAEDAQARFPAVFIQGRSGWLGLDNWADTAGVILINVNDVRNGEWDPIFESQDAVLDAVSVYRISSSLRFATGLSGGGWASVKMAQRHPKEIAGVILHCHSGNGDSPPAGCSVGLIGGLQDNVHPDKLVHEAAEKFGKGGRYVQEAHLNQGHNWAPAAVTSGMLDNMIFHTRMTGSGFDAAERAANAKLPDDVIAKAAAESDATKALAMLTPLVEVEAFRSRPFRSKALALWCERRAQSLSELPDRKAAFTAYAEETTFRHFNESPGSASPAVRSLVQKFSSDASLKNEMPALAEFARMRESYQRETTRNPKVNLKEWAVKFDKFAKKNEGTVAAGLARKIAPKG